MVLLVDQREQFGGRVYGMGPGTGRAAKRTFHVEMIKAKGVNVEERTLNIGDALWIAR